LLLLQAKESGGRLVGDGEEILAEKNFGEVVIGLVPKKQATAARRERIVSISGPDSFGQLLA
jgi:hypothetical protein